MVAAPPNVGVLTWRRPDPERILRTQVTFLYIRARAQSKKTVARCHANTAGMFYGFGVCVIFIVMVARSVKGFRVG